jgi:thiamine kinase-like enzyme
VAEVPTSELEEIFKQVPLLTKFHIEDFQIRPLPGFTNQNFHLKNDQHDWILRIPKLETNLLINRQQEAYNANIASRLGITPECIWRNDSGLSLSQTLLNSSSIKPADINDKTILDSLLKTIARLHKSKNKFHGVVDLTELLPRYYQLAPAHIQSQIKTSYKIAIGKLESISGKEKLMVPSHNDLVLENILIGTTGQVWLIDWEYSSMASPYWDLAILCNAADLNQDQCAWLLDEYKIHKPALDAKILSDYRYMLGVLSICWMSAFSGVDIEHEMANKYC